MSGQTLIFGLGPDGLAMAPARVNGAGQVEVSTTSLKMLVDIASATVTYTCEAKPGTALSAAAWRIRRTTVSGSITLHEWAGTGGFDQVANNRASLTYS